MTAVPVCASCHRPLSAGARFCTGCGARAVEVALAEPVVIPATSGRSRTSWASVGSSGRGTAALDAGERSRPGTRRRRTGSVLSPEFDGAAPVGAGRRLLAYAIDATAVCAVAGGSWVLTGEPVYAALLGSELVIGLLAWEARSGATIGNLALGLRTAKRETPYALGLGRAMRRGLVVAAGHVGLGVGQWLVVASTGFDSSGCAQGWHDKAGDAVVVNVRAQRRAAAAAAAAAARARRPPAPSLPLVPELAVPVQAPIPEARRAPERQQAVAYVITLDTGQAMTVSGPGLIGRAPRVVAGERCDHLVEIDDPQRTLSRTHVRFGIEGAGFWLADAGSGNGTVLVLPNGSSTMLAAEQRVMVPSGSTVRIGGRSFTVRLP